MFGQVNRIRYGDTAIPSCRAGNAAKGFTLVEVIFSILLLGIMVISITGVYFISMNALSSEDDLLPLDSRLRGRMEEVISRSFDAIVDGSDSVTINGRSHTITWTVTHPDLDGDAIPETMAKRVTVTTGDRSLTTLVIDSQAAVGKI
jgi:prepilin-type N-terminal cleavage/methylation domain-containing protein